jgi:hypothetical protein
MTEKTEEVQVFSLSALNEPQAFEECLITTVRIASINLPFFVFQLMSWWIVIRESGRSSTSSCFPPSQQ